MGLENYSYSDAALSRRQFLTQASQAIALGVTAAVGINPAISHAFPIEDGVSSRLICGARVIKPSKAEVEAKIGMLMSTLHQYYEEYTPDPSCDLAGVIDIRLKHGALPVPAMLYPRMLKRFPREWSAESMEILFELAERMPGYYTPEHLIKPALLVLSTSDAVSTPQAPIYQGIVTFSPKTMSYENLKNAARIHVHEGAHLRDPMIVTTTAGAEHVCITCMMGSSDQDNCSDNEKNLPPIIKAQIVKSPLHDAIYNIFPWSSYKNPPPMMKEWADQEFEKLKVAGRVGFAEGPYEPMERWVYGIREKFPAELIGVAAEFIMQSGPDYDFFMEAAIPLIKMGVFQIAQIRSLRDLIIEGPLRGRNLRELSCIFI